MVIGLLWRSEWDPVPPGPLDVENTKLREVFAAFAALDTPTTAVVYSDDQVDAVREELLRLDGVLVWVNPIEQGLDRSRLDPMLRDVAEAGVFVSAHPDVILRMATKKVLWDTRELSWSSDVWLYRSRDQLAAELPARLAERPRVLKQHRGMGGDGVWKVALAGQDVVEVQHASGDGRPQRMALSAFLAQCGPYFDNGLMVEQPYLESLSAGMVRAYLTHDRVVGFTHQYPRGLMPPGRDDRPTGKRFEPPSEPRYAGLRERLEHEWVPQMQKVLGIDTSELPVIWDADFLFGGDDESYVLCEINASSTFAFPEIAMPGVALAVRDRIASR